MIFPPGSYVRISGTTLDGLVGIVLNREHWMRADDPFSIPVFILIYPNTYCWYLHETNLKPFNPTNK